jgi:FdrA protein
MTWVVRVIANRYADSVRLMAVARATRERDDVERCEIAMGTAANLEALAAAGADAAAGPGDLVIAVRAASGAAAQDAVGAAERALTAAEGGGDGADRGRPPPRSLPAAAAELRDATVALISVAGEYATLEAHRALTLGLHVHLFSDHVPVEDEVALKRRATARGLLLMGPECGTAMLGGVGLGFMNVVPRGGVGIVAAAGTGAQECATLVAAAGGGISHVVGVGGRDLSRAVGGMFRRGIELLAADPSTETLLLVSKPGDRDVVLGLAGALPADKRAVAAFVGLTGAELPFEAHATLEAAARSAAGAGGPADVGDLERAVDAAGARGRILGLYSGGTLAHEATTILEPALGAIADDPEADGHAIVDVGDERFTQGRPHPMVDLSLRRALLEDAAGDGRTGVLLLDVVLGHGAHPDPAAELAPAVARVARGALVLARVVGTPADPQDERRQAAALREAGALVAPSNAAAARLAARAVARAAA